ncbi:hypothetical protein KDL01_31535 [Actinospica durhamensis]|uniref:Uncharacterized protein n=1 Tax=Actinospica durhamensis TaxID=1508375 RepID=A0A941EUE6_9ACTN|nr:hypothetical protein [Actinospica durhamensis]
MSPRTTPDVSGRAEQRDRGLRRVRTATGLITIASTAGAVVLAGAYAEAMPGKPAAGTGTQTTAHTATAEPASPEPTLSTQRSVAAAAPTRTESSTRATSSAPAPATSSAPVLKPSAQPPTTAPSTAQTQATSGGS